MDFVRQFFSKKSIAFVNVFLFLMFFSFFVVFSNKLFSLVKYSDFGDLNFYFYKNLIDSLSYSLKHVSILFFLLIVFVPFLSFIFMVTGRRENGINFVSNFLFYLPGTISASALLGVFDGFGFATSGVWITVFLFFVINVLYLSLLGSRFSKEFFYSDKGIDFLISYQSLGLKTLRVLFLKHCFIIFYRLKYWIFTVLFWAFTSFSAVILLSGNKTSVGIEIMMYFEYFKGNSDLRILILFVIHLIFIVMLYFLLTRLKTVQVQKNFKQIGEFRFLKVFKAMMGELKIFKISIFVFKLLVFLFCFIVFFMNLDVLNNSFNFDVLRPFLNTMLLSFLFSVISLIFCFLFLLVNKGVQKLIMFFFFISPTFAVLTVFDWGASFSDLSVYNKVVMYLFIMFILSAPVLYLWIKEERELWSLKHYISYRSLGLSRFDYFRKIIIPKLLPVIEKCVLFSIFSIFAELALSTVFFDDNFHTLGSFVYTSVKNYEFSNLNYLLWLYGLTYVLTLLFLKFLKKFLCVRPPNVEI